MASYPYKTPYEVGDLVLKVGEGYGGPGIVVAKFQTERGEWRYVVAHAIMGGKGQFFHVYAGHNLTRRSE